MVMGRARSAKRIARRGANYAATYTSVTFTASEPRFMMEVLYGVYAT